VNHISKQINSVNNAWYCANGEVTMMVSSLVDVNFSTYNKIHI